MLVERDHDADWSIADEQRYVQRGARAEPACDRLIDLRIVEERGDVLASPPLEDAAGLRILRHLCPEERISTVAGRGVDAKRSLRRRQLDQDGPRIDELPQPTCDEFEQARQLDLSDERIPNLVQRLKLAQPTRCRFVKPRVLNCDRGLTRE